MSSTKKSHPPTYSAQDDLPPLPVPDLDQTLQKYLTSIKPFVNEEGYNRAATLVEELKSGAGPELHQYLLDKAASSKNWLEDWWETVAYMMWREPVAVLVNVVTGFGSFTEFHTPVPQFRRAAEIIRYTMEYQQLLQQQKIPADTMMGRPLCMHMYTRLFSECRVPGEQCDSIETSDMTTIKHVMVTRRGAIFFLRVFDEAGQLLTIGDLETQLARIAAHADYVWNEGAEEYPTLDGVAAEILGHAGIAALTAGRRTPWAEARETLLALPGVNRRNLKMVESSLFSVALSCDSPSSASKLLHSCAGEDPTNRWFDKSLQYVVFGNGMVGANMEHGNADATIMMAMFRWLGERYLNKAGGVDTLIESQTHKYLPPPELARWTVNAEIKTAIQNAISVFNENGDNLQMDVGHFRDFGKTLLKRYRVSPDTFVQMGIQLAWYRQAGHVVPTYESAHTRLFYHGRTETIRSCTEQSAAWVAAMCDGGRTTDAQRWALYQAAAGRHAEVAMAALQGEGCDRHLLGLQLAAHELGVPAPALFADPAYSGSGGGGNFTLSSSNVSGYLWLWGGFAPMVEQGYGVCYDIQSDKLGMLVSAWNKCPATDAVRFRAELNSAFRSMGALIEGNATPRDASSVTAGGGGGGTGGEKSRL